MNRVSLSVNVDECFVCGRGTVVENISNPDSLPLAERFHVAQYLRRELSEHMRQAFLPKFSDLRHASKVLDVEEVTDQEMLDKMLASLQADEFAAQLFGKLFRYLDSIERETRSLMGVTE